MKFEIKLVKMAAATVEADTIEEAMEIIDQLDADASLEMIADYYQIHEDGSETLLN